MACLSTIKVLGFNPETADRLIVLFDNNVRGLHIFMIHVEAKHRQVT